MYTSPDLVYSCIYRGTEKEDVCKMQKKINILVIDSTNGDGDILKSVLKEKKLAGHLVNISDGEKATEYFSDIVQDEGNNKPQLIILNIDLPDMDGWQVLDRLKKDKVLKVIPVVLLSKDGSNEDVYKAHNMYANCFIIKKGDEEEVKEIFSRIADFWLQTATLPDSLHF